MIRHTCNRVLMVLIFMCLVAAQAAPARSPADEDDMKKSNDKIRQEKFNLVLPQAMKKYGIDLKKVLRT